jgi:2-pyrone-4,6-dicarboxylate lactonase
MSAPKPSFLSNPGKPEIPDDRVMVDNLAEIAPSEKQRQALLVDNPSRLYFS